MDSRSIKSFNNITSGILSKILLFLAAFFARTVFIKTLGAQYTGVNGLYSNILAVLSLADLGAVNVLSFFLYEALHENDQEKIAGVIQAFKKIYTAIGMAVFGIGILMIPLLPIIIHSPLDNQRLIEYYVLYLLNTSVSYFFAYKTIILTADQKQYYENFITMAVQIIMYALQTVYLLAARNYAGFLIIQIVCTIVKNIVLSMITDRHYPFLRHHVTRSCAFDFKSRMRTDIRAAMLYKAGSVFLNYTDNILISALAGTVYVGYYSNYSLIFGYIGAYVNIAATGVTASLGSMNTDGNAGKSYHVYRTLSFLFASGAGIVINAAGCCIQEIIPLWIGTEYVLDEHTFFAALLLEYVNYISTPALIFRETLGYFRETEYLMIPTVFINIMLSIVWGRKYGICGILLASSVSKLLTQFWYEPRVLYKKFFQKSYHLFWKQQVKSAAITAGCLMINRQICRFLPETIIGIAARAAVPAVLTAAVIFFLYRNSFEMKDILYRVHLLRGMGRECEK